MSQLHALPEAEDVAVVTGPSGMLARPGVRDHLPLSAVPPRARLAARRHRANRGIPVAAGLPGTRLAVSLLADAAEGNGAMTSQPR